MLSRGCSTCRITSHLMMQTVLVFLSEPSENCNLAQTCYTMRSNSHPQSTKDIHHPSLDLLPAYTTTPLHLFAPFSTEFQPQLGALCCPWMKAVAVLPLTSPSSLLLLFLYMLGCLRPLLKLWLSDLSRSLDFGVRFLLCLKHWKEKTKCLIRSRRVSTRFQLSQPPTCSFISFWWYFEKSSRCLQLSKLVRLKKKHIFLQRDANPWSKINL